jgi:hypothetical protein
MTKKRHVGQQEELIEFRGHGVWKCVTPPVTLPHPGLGFNIFTLSCAKSPILGYNSIRINHKEPSANYWDIKHRYLQYGLVSHK